MATLILLLPIVPAAVAAIIAVAGWQPATAWLPTVSCLTVTGLGITLAAQVLDNGPVSTAAGQFASTR
ncbi:MAG: hypothetical protein IPP16_04190 [Acidimicrobiaceae bacterium]|nr:hypothetical protein [Acidimicrobiaceae bacterium]